MPHSDPALHARFQAALDALVQKLQGDSYIVAAMLFGSLAYDSVWQKSDIDLILVGRDERWPFRQLCLVEDSIDIHATLYSRQRFKRQVEQYFQSSFFSSALARSRLLFSHDPTIADYYAEFGRLGAADQERGLMLAALELLPSLAKAEKWLVVKHDPAYCFQWFTSVVAGLARIEILRNGAIPGRELVQQATPFNPELFQRLYFDLLDRPKTMPAMRAALDELLAYLDSHAPALFAPLLRFLEEAGGPRSMSEINAHFQTRLQTETVAYGCEWLADRGLLLKLATPLRLTERSRVNVDEAAYTLTG
jgi:predicted nucleotidyltransferase